MKILILLLMLSFNSYGYDFDQEYNFNNIEYSSPRIIFIWYQNENQNFKWDMGFRKIEYYSYTDNLEQENEFSLKLYFNF